MIRRFSECPPALPGAREIRSLRGFVFLNHGTVFTPRNFDVVGNLVVMGDCGCESGALASRLAVTRAAADLMAQSEVSRSKQIVKHMTSIKPRLLLSGVATLLRPREQGT